MKYLNSNSLFRTVDNVSEALLFGFEIDSEEKKVIAEFIVSRQLKEAYAGTFAPTAYDSMQDLILFTGERIKTRAGKYHTIGEEASRILRKLKLTEAESKAALENADRGMRNQIESLINDPKYPYQEYGMYCCRNCSCPLWLNLASGGLYSDMNMLNAGMQYLKRFRDGKGSWKGFPVNYVLYVLNEISEELTMDELKYAGPAIEKKLKKNRSGKSVYHQRRVYICEQLLDKINSH